MALNAGPVFKFNEAISFFVGVDTQAEIDELWEKLIAGGGSPSRCGWLKDKYGLSWQIVPNALGQMLSDKDPAKVRPLHERDAADVQARCREAARGVQRRVARFAGRLFGRARLLRCLLRRRLLHGSASGLLCLSLPSSSPHASSRPSAPLLRRGRLRFRLRREHVLQIVGFAQPVGDRRFHLVTMRDVEDVVHASSSTPDRPASPAARAPSAPGTRTTSRYFRFGRTKK